MYSHKVSVQIPPITYPCLKEYKPTGLVVLFNALNTGTVVHKGDESDQHNDIGRYSTSWGEYNFVPFYGNVTLEN